MASEFERLASAARELAAAAEGRPEGERARSLAERLEAGRFLIAFVGEFKRGKSTLINALVGEAVLPAGALPLTAVATELVWGEPGAVVELVDGTALRVSQGDIAQFVTEASNPRNVRGVARVEVHGRWPLCASGAVLVDAPGTGSVYDHNTEAGRRALLDADGAVMVMAADQPLSAAEREMVQVLRERRGPVFYVLNKADHLDPSELDEVRRFVGSVLAEELGQPPRLYAVSALDALRARSEGAVPGPRAGEFEAFRADLERFVREDLAAARLATARDELVRLAGAVGSAVAVERAAVDMEMSTLAERVAHFRAEAARQRRAFDDACALFDRDVTRLATEAGQRLQAFARAASSHFAPRLPPVASESPRRRLRAALWEEVERCVREAFESFRHAEAARVDEAWRHLAEEFRAAAQRRVEGVRAAAAELFEVPLPEATVPALSASREGFFYLFIPATTFNEPFLRLAERLLPGRLARRWALTWATDLLARELDKHAGRARADLVARLHAARRDFESAMQREIDETVSAVLAAADRAAAVRDAADLERARWLASAQEVAAVAERVADIARGAGSFAASDGAPGRGS